MTFLFEALRPGRRYIRFYFTFDQFGFAQPHIFWGSCQEETILHVDEVRVEMSWNTHRSGLKRKLEQVDVISIEQLELIDATVGRETARRRSGPE